MEEIMKSKSNLDVNKPDEVNPKMMLKFVSSCLFFCLLAAVCLLAAACWLSVLLTYHIVKRTFVQNSVHLPWQRALSPIASKIFTPTALMLLTNSNHFGVSFS